MRDHESGLCFSRQSVFVADLLIANTVLEGTDNAQKDERFSDFIDDFDSGKRLSD
jgi:hypothetical protein